MKPNDKTKAGHEPGRPFLQRFAPAIAVAVALTIVIAAFAVALMVIRRDTPVPTAAVAQVASEDLPGPKGDLSARSKAQVDTLAAGNEHAVMALVVRYKYTKTQIPFAHTWAANPQAQAVIDGIVSRLMAEQNELTGRSSEEVRREDERDPDFASRRIRNSEEARVGLIKCVPIADAALVYSELKTTATGICIATIPPFESNTSMAIIILTDSEMSQSAELAEMRRMMLSLQIDIYNRDFQGRETWAHP